MLIKLKYLYVCIECVPLLKIVWIMCRVFFPHFLLIYWKIKWWGMQMVDVFMGSVADLCRIDCMVEQAGSSSLGCRGVSNKVIIRAYSGLWYTCKKRLRGRATQNSETWELLFFLPSRLENTALQLQQNFFPTVMSSLPTFLDFA